MTQAQIEPQMGKRLLALDGLRGICSIIVLLFHDLRFSHPRPFIHGYLSVDVFFVLSGFVLAFAFGDKLIAGMSVYDFMKSRVRRLGPTLVMGILFGSIGVVLQHVYPPPLTLVCVVLFSAMLNVLLVPFATNDRLDAFPINSPSWSLFAEFWVNVGFGLLAGKLRRPALIGIILAGWVFLVIYSARNGSADFGATQATVLYSIPRAIPSFACGVLLCDLWKTGALARLPSVNPLLLFALWMTLALIPCSNYCAIYDLVQILVGAPVLVALLARYQGAVPSWATWTGKISYPLYAIHIPIIYTSQVLLLRNGRMPMWAEVVFPLVAIAAADLISRYELVIPKGWRRKATLAIAPLPEALNYRGRIG